MSGEFHQHRIGAYINALRQVGFVNQVEVAKTAAGTRASGAVVTITDRDGLRFQFQGQIKTSYFDRASVNATVAHAQMTRRRREDPVLVLARYVPLPTGERLLEAGVNFVDLVGNMHVTLGTHYERTILGRMEPQKQREKQRVTPAQLQVLFLFASQPQAVSWPVRDIAIQAGVSKSKAADARGELIAAGLVSKASDRFRLSQATEELLVSGYAQTLRPKLVLGRFRAPEKELSDFLKRLPAAFEGSVDRYALNGGPAADALQHFYRGPEAPLFVSDSRPELRQRLRLLPDRNGPVTLLRAFGEVVFWRQVSSGMVAPPWIVYSELMNADDPRAHEAAAELRQEFLTS